MITWVPNASGTGEARNRLAPCIAEWDSSTLDSLLDPAFVSSPWNAPDELLMRDAYIRKANCAQFRGCELTPVYMELIGNFAIVKCHIACEYNVKGRKWTVELSITDIWVRRTTTPLKDSRQSGRSSQEG
jgi:hypothetical protein